MRGDDHFFREQGRYLPPHDLQQNPHAAGAVQPLEAADDIAEYSRNNAHGFTRPNVRPPLNYRQFTTGFLQTLDHSSGHRRGMFTLHHQSRDTIGAVHAAPAVAGKIESDKQITGKERDEHGFGLPRMAPYFSPAWKENLKALIAKMRNSGRFTMRKALDCIPAATRGSYAFETRTAQPGRSAFTF
jgi:hypothetical protein